jgi:energy-coupling factor transporter ATP-binding protein EcfA2
MKKITSIQFVNYKAFYSTGEKNNVRIPEGKNVLIYGENGSGKSSVYEGMKQFFNSADNTQEVNPSRHLKVARSETINVGELDETLIVNEVAVKVIFKDNGIEDKKTFGVPDENVRGTRYISNANLLNSFLSYRELLRTYLMEDVKDRGEFRSKFAYLLIETILAKNKNSGTQSSYISFWEHLHRPRGRNKYKDFDRFETGLNKDIAAINLILNDVLGYFEPDLNVKLELTEAYIEYYHCLKVNRLGYYPICEVDLKVKLFGTDIENEEENHLTVLNEARLSAIAISIYFASLINAPQIGFDYKILFLDDIFIGLDMSNRIPLLHILTKFKKPIIEQLIDETSGLIVNGVQLLDGIPQYEPIPFFNSYQVFITTYDKHWFAIAKNYLDDNHWQSIEMYSHFDEDLKFNVPLIMTPSHSYLEKAQLYFKKNSEYKDYPASANYLRKESEQQLKRILFGNYLLKNGDKGTVQLREELDELRQSFEKLLTDLGIETNSFDNFTNIIKSTLNPLSHDNLQKPIYKRELEDAFKLVSSLKSISKVVVVEKGLNLTVHTNSLGIERITTLTILSDVYKLEIGNTKKFTSVFLRPLKFEEQNVTTKLRLPDCNIEKAYDMIQHSVFGVNNASSGVDIFPFFIMSNGETLAEKFV